MRRSSPFTNLQISKPLTEDQIREFDEKGFVIVDFGFDVKIIEQVVDDLKFLYPPRKAKHSYPPGTRVQDAWKQSNSVFQIATSPLVFASLKQLFGRNAKAFQTLNFPVGTQQKVHSDTIHFSSIPSGYMAGVWVALEDVTVDNGPIIYYPGSHKMPEYNMQDIGQEPGHHNYRHYEAFIQQKVDESGIKPHYGTMKKGEALIWHANLLHGGSERKNPTTTRNSQVTHYYFDNCQYYTPMLSDESKIVWREPKWISKEKPNVLSLSRKLFSKVKSSMTSKQ